MNIDEKFAEMADLDYLDIAIQTVKTVLTEYRYKYWQEKPIRFDISKGRFESQGIYIDDVEFIILKYFSSDHTLKNATMRVENNYILKGNTKFMTILAESSKSDRDTFDHMLDAYYKNNLQKYADVLAFLFVPPFTYEDLLKKYSELRDLAEQKKLIISKDISNYIFWDDFILNIKIPGEINYRQLDFSPTKNTFAKNQHDFVRALVVCIYKNAEVSDNTIEAPIKKSDILKEMNKRGNVEYTSRQVDYAKSHFFNEKLPKDVRNYFVLSDYQKSTDSYNFKFLLKPKQKHTVRNK